MSDTPAIEPLPPALEEAAPKTLTPPWAYYRRTGLSEMRPYVPGEDLTGISVSDPDKGLLAAAAESGENPGGYIARNPRNHADQWYVAQAYFDANFELVDVPVVARDDTAELVEALEAVTKAAYDPGAGQYAVTRATMRRVQAALARVKEQR